ncbi:MAG: HEAT repeat domain-containing protein [Deltaproteobacteria bacterium]|nr:HEAT repeat domain-containing protein [Deltaproteobacteria bacterium]
MGVQSAFLNFIQAAVVSAPLPTPLPTPEPVEGAADEFVPAGEERESSDTSAWPPKSVVVDRAAEETELDLIIQGLRSPDRNERNESLFKLRLKYIFGSIPKSAAEPLIPLLRDRDHDVRAHAVSALGRTGASRAVDLIIPRLKDSHHSVREFSANALGRLGDQRAVNPLMNRLSLEETDSVLVKVIEALGTLDDKRAVTPLLPFLNHGNESVQTAVVTALGFIGDTRVRDNLFPFLNHPSDNVQVQAALALGRLGDKRAFAKLIEIAVNRATPNFPTRWEATSILGDLAVEEAVIPLLNIAKDQTLKDKDSPKNFAIITLARIGDPRATDAIKKYQGGKFLPLFYKNAAAQAEREGRLVDAVVYYEHLMELEPSDYSYPLKVGDLYRQLHNVEAAEASYRRSLDLCDDCDGLAVKRALAKLQFQRGISREPLSFVGFMDAKSEILKREQLDALNIFLASEMRDEGLTIHQPDLWETVNTDRFNADRASLSSTTLTAEIATVASSKAGFYGTVEKIGGSNELIFTLNYVEAEDSDITHQATVVVPKSKLQTSDDVKSVAQQLAWEMSRVLHQQS